MAHNRLRTDLPISDAIAEFKNNWKPMAPEIGLTSKDEENALLHNFTKLINEGLIDENCLDDLVHDVKEREASLVNNLAYSNETEIEDTSTLDEKSEESRAINNEGHEAQLRYLLDSLGMAGLMATINEFRQTQIDALFTEFKDLLAAGVDENCLDDLVHDEKEREASALSSDTEMENDAMLDEKSKEASAINNEGYEAQLHYLLGSMGIVELRSALSDIKHPATPNNS